MDKMDYVALFDLDGVILDTENDYTKFWDTVGEKFTNQKGFGHKIKGQTLVKILNDHFPDADKAKEVTEAVYAYEKEMRYDYIPGAEAFLDGLKAKGIKTAIVTSSDLKKMSNVFAKHPDFKSKFDYILTSEDFSRSKPDPECYLKGMELLESDPQHTIVFEDSVSGLKSGKASGAIVVALSTTNPVEVVEPLSDYVISDFRGYKLEDFVGVKSILIRENF